ncbi:MAG TPA: ComEC/Rec2 family competence protein [Candidatus Dependentiae bacterium]|nr:ComEC/Rec2 family competence protein [Candidatus Dependentiae bacterium]HRQ62975.1 ComEC/Rec2 family competence protein [Candidatus Dependentiae bacterium]
MIKEAFIELLKTLPPLSIATLALILGIITQQYLPGIAIFILSTILIIIVPLLIYKNTLSPKSIKAIALFVIVFLSGAISSIYQQSSYDHFYHITQEKPFTLIGSITDLEETPHNTMHKQVTIKINEIQPHTSSWQNYSGSLYIYTNNTDKLNIGDQICIHNILCKKTKNNSFVTYLIKQGIAGCVFVKNLNYYLIHPSPKSWRYWIHTIRNQILKQCAKKLKNTTSSLFASLFLGNKNNYKKELEPMTHQFQMWGLSHYLARSGLHLVIFIALWHMLLSILPVALILKQFILLALTFLYAALSWSSISFIRALSTFTLFKICTLNKRQGHVTHLLTLVCIITLLINPIQLFFLDFQLSFMLTFALTWFNYMQSKKLT